MDIVLGQGGRNVQLDETRGCLVVGGMDIPLDGFLRMSAGRPWALPRGGCRGIRGCVEDGRMRVDWATEDFEASFDCGFIGGGVLDCHATWRVLRDVRDAAFAVCVPVPDDAVVTLPMSLYNDNPSTPRERIVPRFPKAGRGWVVFEDSRYPVPGANAEFGDCALTLLLRPGLGNSLGCFRFEPGETHLVAASGVIAFNGAPDVCYGMKNGTRPAEKGYRDMSSGESFALEFGLEWGVPERPGQGFRRMVDGALAYLNPSAVPALDVPSVIELKTCAMNALWCGDGYMCLPPENLYGAPQYFLYGWAGQCMKMALCELKLYLARHDSASLDRMMAAVSFFVEHSQTSTPGLRNQAYYLAAQEWRPSNEGHVHGVPSRAEGETWADLGRIILACREHGIPLPPSFAEALEEGLEFMWRHRLPSGIVPRLWNEDGTAGAEDDSCAGTSFLSALWAMARLSEKDVWRQRAAELHELYWKLGGNDFSTPFSRATLDSGCEDKEACIPFFVACCEAWSFTGEPRYRHYAEASGDWLLTWVYFWDVPLRADSICALNGFRTCGWPAVSVENQHLDVFFPAWEMAEFGMKTGQDKYARCGRMVFDAWTHGISRGGGDWLFSQPGAQPEQFFQTDWVFDDLPIERLHEPFLHRMRKYGYRKDNVNSRNACGGANPWSPSWIVPLVLYAALGFQDNTEKQA